MKALILAGGKGTRLRPITFSMSKQLLPVANKPVIEYGIESIIDAGITDFGIIVGDTHEEVKKAIGDGSRWGIQTTFIHQPNPLGLAHAVKTARDFLGEDDFIMYLGDNLIKSSVVDLVRDFEAKRPAATILLTEVPNPSDFGVAEMVNDKVVRLEEKPKNPRSNLALVGVYLFDKQIHRIIETLKPSGRGEYEITDAIQSLINEGLTVRSHIIEGWWKDTGTVEAILEANRLILESLEPCCEGQTDSSSRIEGRVRVGKGSRVVNSTIRGPVVIGDHCLIDNSFVGPFTSIDSHTEVTRVEVENSIILADCLLEGITTRIEGSLIGRGAHVCKSTGMPRTVRLVLGDSSAVTLP
jgi:glucose-1-phosphate thymidylyltransferase